jgi:hypothetical protein
MGPIFSYPSPQVYNKPAPAAEPEFGTFPRIPRTNVSGVTRDLCRFARLVPPAGGDFREDDAGAASDGAGQRRIEATRHWELTAIDAIESLRRRRRDTAKARCSASSGKSWAHEKDLLRDRDLIRIARADSAQRGYHALAVFSAATPTRRTPPKCGAN